MMNGLRGVLFSLIAIVLIGCNLSAQVVDTPIPDSGEVNTTPTQSTGESSLPTLTPTNNFTIIPTSNTSNTSVLPASTLNPTPQTACLLNTTWPTYTVQSGDTLTSIAADTGSTVDELVQANCMANPDILTVGTVLYVPQLPAGNTPVNTPIGQTQARIISLSSSTQSANPGAQVTINWQIEGAQMALVEIWQVYNLSPGSPSVYNADPRNNLLSLYDSLPLTGSYTYPIPANFEGDVRFIVWAANRQTSTTGPQVTYQRLASSYVHVTVATSTSGGQPCFPTFYRNTCNLPLQRATTQAAYQAFERGFMLWRADTEEIFVFAALTSGSYGSVYRYPLSTYTNLPSNPVTDTPPSGRTSPVQGFGRVWGNNASVRSLLGWGLAPEAGYTMTVAFTRAPVQAPYFYMTMPEGGLVVQVSNNNTFALEAP